jgi:Transposase IS66 family
VRCRACGGEARAQFPDEVSASAFGPRLQAAVPALSVRNRVSRRDVIELSEELFAARISTGAVEAILARAAATLTEPYEDLLARARCAGALNVDETGLRTAGERRAPCERVFLGVGVFAHTHDRRPPEAHGPLPATAPTRRSFAPMPQSAQQALPRHGAQPPEDPARAVDVR